MVTQMLPAADSASDGKEQLSDKHLVWPAAALLSSDEVLSFDSDNTNAVHKYRRPTRLQSEEVVEEDEQQQLQQQQERQNEQTQKQQRSRSIL